MNRPAKDGQGLLANLQGREGPYAAPKRAWSERSPQGKKVGDGAGHGGFSASGDSSVKVAAIQKGQYVDALGLHAELQKHAILLELFRSAVIDLDAKVCLGGTHLSGVSLQRIQRSMSSEYRVWPRKANS